MQRFNNNCYSWLPRSRMGWCRTRNFKLPLQVPKQSLRRFPAIIVAISAHLGSQLQTPLASLLQVMKICTRWLESSNTRCEWISGTSTTVFDMPNTTTSRWVQTATSTNCSQLEHTGEMQVRIVPIYIRGWDSGNQHARQFIVTANSFIEWHKLLHA